MNYYRFIGIGGIGMSALARILLQKGAKVEGSDLVPSHTLSELEQLGATIVEEKARLKRETTVIFSSAVQKNHPIYRAAIEEGAPLLHRSQLLASLMKDQKGLLVAGTHGKTSSSSLLAHLLKTSSMDPSFVVGGIPLNFETNGALGEGEFFVAEADESDGSFHNLSGHAAIITSIGDDHLDYWKNMELLMEGFRSFAEKVSPLLYWYRDDPILASLNLKGESYGWDDRSDIHIISWKQKGWSLLFDINYRGKLYKDLMLPLVGKHNVANGAAVFGLGLRLGISEEKMREAFSTFKGVKRRLEKKGEKRGVLFYDDYAHHPTEIATTLEGIRKAIGKQRLVVLFQPHRYSRVQYCWNSFITAFKQADLLVVTDIYSAGESPIPGIEGRRLSEAIGEISNIPLHFAHYEQLVEVALSLIRPHDYVVTLGAGSITEIGVKLLEHPLNRWQVALCRGGVSTEHEISLRSAEQFLHQMNPDYYSTELFTISKEGTWSNNGTSISLPEAVERVLCCEWAIPILHGPFGEDGSIQGFFETLGVPYIGPDFRSCVVAMDKVWSKQLAAAQGVKVAAFLYFTAAQWEADPSKTVETLLDRFAFPFYLKPVHLGSTVGVKKVTNQEEMIAAIEAICRIDYSFLVEEEVVGREFEFGLIGNDPPMVADPIEIIRHDGFHSYENKYSDQAIPPIVHPPLAKELLEEGKALAQKVYNALGCSGCSRIDFFLVADRFWVMNEVNSIPGFTLTSGYPIIWKAEGYSLSSLIDQIVITSLSYKRNTDRRLRSLRI